MSSQILPNGLYQIKKKSQTSTYLTLKKTSSQTICVLNEFKNNGTEEINEENLFYLFYDKDDEHYLIVHYKSFECLGVEYFNAEEDTNVISIPISFESKTLQT